MKNYLLFVSGLIFITHCQAFWYDDTSESKNICDEESFCHCPVTPYNTDEAIANCSHIGINNIKDDMIIPGGILKVDFSYNKISSLSSKMFQSPVTHVLNLDFSNNHLKDLPPGLFSNFENLKTLNFANNYISAIDISAFESLVNLIYLELSFNNISALPIGVFDPLVNLKRLNLASNPIISLENRLFNGLQNMQFLSLSNLHMESLDTNIFNRLKMKALDLSNNNYTQVPTEALKSISNTLQALSLSNNPIKELNEYSFIGLPNLKSLHLSRMRQLEEIGPFTFQNLELLDAITLDDNINLKNIDPKAFYLHKESRIKCRIIHLSITNTQLTSLSKDLLFWDKISHIQVKNNKWICDCKMNWLVGKQFADIDGGFNCEEPEYLHGQDLKDLDPTIKLDCSHTPVIKPEFKVDDTWELCSEDSLCKCPHVSDGLNKMVVDCSDREITYIDEYMHVDDVYTKIDFSQNYIKSLSVETFSDVEPSIKELDLSSNSLEILKSGSFKRLPNLQKLELYNNNLYNLEEQSFAGLANLIVLDLHYNNIDHLPVDIFDPLVNLERLNIGYNSFTTIEERLFKNLTQLKILNLAFLKLKTIHHNTFKNLNLQHLNLDHNEFTAIPIQALQQIKNSLKELIISANPIKSLNKESFYGLQNLHEIQMKQLLQLEEIDAYSFKGLNKLETITLMYLPRLNSINKMAFHTSEENNKYCPIKDFTLAFTMVTSLDEELLQWDDVNYLDVKNNHWTCDCNLAWIKDTKIDAMSGNEIYCSNPVTLRWTPLTSVKKEEMKCGVEVDPHSSVTLGLLIALILIGIVASLSTVSYLSYKRNGFLFKRPVSDFQYGRLSEEQMKTFTIVDEN